MWRYIAKRLLLMVPTLFGILLVTFMVIQFVPGGPVEQLARELRGAQVGETVTTNTGFYRASGGLDADRLAELKTLYGFDKPAYQRFGDMIWRYLHFDLGESFYHHQSVGSLVVSKLPVSMSLGLWTFFLTYLISIPLGIRKAVRDGSAFDVATSTLLLVGYAIPGFVLGVALLVLFGGGSFLEVFPLRGLVSDNWNELGWPARIADYLWHMVLPVTASVVGSLAVMTLLTKNTFLEQIRSQYVLTARAKGVSENRILYKHVFRNAMIPLITGFPSAFIGAFFSGSLLIETIFSLDGLGLLSYDAVVKRDYPVVMGTLYLFTLIGLVARLLSDLCYVWVDPRLRFDSVGG
ncbi:microcin C ABC transporter permease YejB [Microvirgula aerodenitrificans]|uniref:microcin C ABC transporter permease YejB n=1 Tax=Microvirgula aerodenitrificans TaxID=57480 RepID=UPI00248F3A8B|nr:ABC transporter permease subunit [Microvirgula aerodenitrificans]